MLNDRASIRRVLVNGNSMKLLSKLVVIASALAAGNALAADQNAFFEMQRMVTDGYYATHPGTPPAPAHRETSRTAHAL